MPIIGKSKAKMAIVKHIEGYFTLQENINISFKLNTLGFTIKEAISLLNKYKLNIFNIIENNIYQLCDDISFNKLDQMFLKDNDEKNSNRVEALIKHSINELCYSTGNTILTKEEVFIKMKTKFNGVFSSKEFIKSISVLLEKGMLIEINNYIALYDYYERENYIIDTINRLNNIKNVTNDSDIIKAVNNLSKKYSLVLDDKQLNAVKEAIKNNFYIITGGPGTGKTTIVKLIVDVLIKSGEFTEDDIALLSPTGRSAKKLSESVNLPASTIHKYLKWNKETNEFQINEINKAKERLIIIDEASMLDIFLFSSLLKGLRNNIKIILIGDASQLPSIAPGDILNDLLSKEYIKKTYLEIIYRVKEGSYISFLADDIKKIKTFNNIKSYEDFEFIESTDEEIIHNLEKVCVKMKKNNINLNDFQVLAPMYKGYNGIDNLNNIMSNIFNEEETSYKIYERHYKVNDKVIQLVNDMDNNIYNGDIGYICDIGYENKSLQVSIDFDGNIVKYNGQSLDNFSLAYAISIHKSQGSEYDNVVIILSSTFNRMFYNKLIYTAVTRAKQNLIIIGSLSSLNKSITTLYSSFRQTYLKLIK